jgi:hypothetical protein
MKSPIIILEHGDISIYLKVEDAECSLEATDVKNDEYRAYDATGRPLLLRVVVEERLSAFGLFRHNVERVKLQEDPEAEADEECLKDVLMKFLKRIGEVSQSEASNCALPELIDRLVHRIGYS